MRREGADAGTDMLQSLWQASDSVPSLLHLAASATLFRCLEFALRAD